MKFSECQEPLGMENGAISNGQITASSQWDNNYAAIQGRLNFQGNQNKKGSWSARSNNNDQWLQVDLGGEHTHVTRVATQGRHDYPQWVTKYKLQYSSDGVNFKYHREQGQNADKVNSTYTTETLINRISRFLQRKRKIACFSWSPIQIVTYNNRT